MTEKQVITLLNRLKAGTITIDDAIQSVLDREVKKGSKSDKIALAALKRIMKPVPNYGYSRPALKYAHTDDQGRQWIASDKVAVARYPGYAVNIPECPEDLIFPDVERLIKGEKGKNACTIQLVDVREAVEHKHELFTLDFGDYLAFAKPEQLKNAMEAINVSGCTAYSKGEYTPIRIESERGQAIIAPIKIAN